MASKIFPALVLLSMLALTSADPWPMPHFGGIHVDGFRAKREAFPWPSLDFMDTNQRYEREANPDIDFVNFPSEEFFPRDRREALLGNRRRRGVTFSDDMAKLY